MHKKELIKMANVIGHSEDKDTVTVYVTKKLKMTTIHRKIKNAKDPFTEDDVIPKEVKTGLFKKKKTDVIEIGHVKAQTDRYKYRPLIGGCEIGPFKYNYVGTLGMVVKIKYFNGLYLVGLWYSFLKLFEKIGFSTEERFVILTNSHVANKDVENPKVDIITQPGASIYESQIVGTNLYSEKIKMNRTNYLDAALIKLDEDIMANYKEILTIGEVQGIAAVQEDETVCKCGRTTEYTEGKCITKNVSINIDYGDGKLAYFAGLDMFTGMSDHGDSGSIIVRKSDNMAVSLLFAGSDQVTFGIPMPHVRNKLKFEVG